MMEALAEVGDTVMRVLVGATIPPLASGRAGATAKPARAAMLIGGAVIRVVPAASAGIEASAMAAPGVEGDGSRATTVNAADNAEMVRAGRTVGADAQTVLTVTDTVIAQQTMRPKDRRTTILRFQTTSNPRTSMPKSAATCAA